jgi:hypothetical protein
MSDAFYTDMANTALGVIKDFQQGLLTLERRSLVAGAEPWDPGVPQVQSYSVIGVVQSIDRRLVDGTTVLATDRLAILPAHSLPANVAPLTSDVLVIDNEPTVIKKVLRVPEAGIVIVYRLVLGS